jgi:hypothetical protein
MEDRTRLRELIETLDRLIAELRRHLIEGGGQPGAVPPPQPGNQPATPQPANQAGTPAPAQPGTQPGTPAPAQPAAPVDEIPPVTPSPAETTPGVVSTVRRACRKFALLVGINDYRRDAKSPNGIFGPLGGCENDVNTLALKLIRDFGFEERDIQILHSGAATKAAILQALRSMVDDLKDNDAAVFQYSGHGTQFVDQAPLDEIDDFLDEAIVPVDYATSLILDDELNVILRRKSPEKVNLAVIFDSCHSGTGLRAGNTEGRSGQPASQVTALKKLIAESGRTLTTRGAAPTFAGEHILLAASDARETALDTGTAGLYSSILIPNMRVGITYQALHAATAPRVTTQANTLIFGHRQTPQLEGTNRGRKIFECLGPDNR